MDCFNSQSYPAAKACAHETHGSLFAFVRIRSGGPEISKSGFWVLGPGCWVPTDAQYSACWCFWYLRLAPPLAQRRTFDSKVVSLNPLSFLRVPAERSGSRWLRANVANVQ